MGFLAGYQAVQQAGSHGQGGAGQEPFGIGARPEASLELSWATNGTPVCFAANGQQDPHVCTDSAGGAFIVWTDARSDAGDIYAQHISAAGTSLWAINGIPVCTALNMQLSPRLVYDGVGGVIITWQHERSGDSIYAQRISTAGVAMWGANGTPVCIIGNSFSPQLCNDGAGGAIIMWHRSTIGNGIVAQRISASGVTLWASNGIMVCTSIYIIGNHVLASDGAGGAIIAWEDENYDDGDIYAQHVSTTGAILWTTNGIVVCNAGYEQFNEQMVDDGAGGAIITWQDRRNGNDDIYAQRVNASGGSMWNVNGYPVCTATGPQQGPSIVSDDNGGAIISWSDLRGSSYDIYAQRVSAAGACMWIVNGTPVCTEVGSQYLSDSTNDGARGAIITWEDIRNGLTRDIYAQRVDLGGVMRWGTNGCVICPAPNEQYYPSITSDGAGGAIVAWQDQRYGAYDIYAQKISNAPPSANAPADVTTWQGGASTIPWILGDDQGAGQYRITVANGSNGFPYVWIGWTPWVNGTSLNVSINRIALGTFIYTIEYTDDQNVAGGSDTVTVSVKDFVVSGANTVSVVAGAAVAAVQWTIVDGLTNTPAFAVLRNGSKVQNGSWSPGVPLTFSLTNLAPGIYNFTLVAMETGGAMVQKTTIVTVVAATTTISTTDILLGVFVGLTCVGLVLVLLVLLRMNKDLKKQANRDTTQVEQS